MEKSFKNLLSNWSQNVSKCLIGYEGRSCFFLDLYYNQGMRSANNSKEKQEVCRARSTQQKVEEGANSVLNPYYIAGFVDGEGCFSISIYKHKERRHGLDVKLVFEIELRADDREILERLKRTLDCGNIYTLNYERYNWYPHVKFKVGSLVELRNKVIPFFKEYRLQAKKKLSFNLFCQAVEIMSSKDHLTKSGMQKLLVLKKKINKYDGLISGTEVPPGYGKTVRPAAEES